MRTWIHQVIALVGMLSLAGLSAAQPADTDASQRLDALRALGRQAPLTILPVWMQGAPSQTGAEVLGLVLEKQGMEKLELAAGGFTPAAEAEWDQRLIALGEHLRKNRPATDYAVYAEYLGEPREGPSEVRFAILTAAGELVLADRQTRQDADFKKTAGRDPDPLGCSALVAERMRRTLKWNGSAKPVSHGKFEQLWAAKSGTPDAAERAAMQQRLSKFKAAAKPTTIRVYATRVNDQVDAASAARLGTALAKQLGAQATAATEPTAFSVAPSSNQQKRLWDLARGFQQHLKASPPDTAYALLAECLIDPQKNEAHAVHWVLCDQAGDWVVVDFQNNQHPDFQRIKPRTVEDCEKLVLVRALGCLK